MIEIIKQRNIGHVRQIFLKTIFCFLEKKNIYLYLLENKKQFYVIKNRKQSVF